MIDKKLNAQLKTRPKYVILLVVLGIAGGVLIVTQAFYLATIIDNVFLQKMGLDEVWNTLWLLLGVLISRGFLVLMTLMTGHILSEQVKQKLREELVHKLSGLDVRYLVEEKTGKLVNIVLNNIDQLDPYFSRYLPQIFQAAIIPAMVLLIVFSQSMISGFIMLVTAPLIPVFMVLIGRLVEGKTQKQLKDLMRFSGHFLDVLQGLTDLKVFGQSKEQSKRLFEMGSSFRNSTMDILKIAFLSALMLEILATISTAMIAVEIGLRLIYGRLTFHTAFFILLVTPELYLPLKNLGSSFHAGRSSIEAGREIFEIMDMKKEHAGSSGSEAIPGPLPPRIDLHKVSFQYHKNMQAKNILNGLDLSIDSGQKAAIVGRSGSGKTTILKLIMGLMAPTGGCITVNGLPLSSISQDEWFKQIAYVPQDPYIFSGTISDNIAIGKEGAALNEIKRAARLAGAHCFIEKLPLGYETVVGEGVRGLSGGERQRIALARAFLKEASVVLLDEPTSGLDLESERIIKKALAGLRTNCTMIVVAHRLQTVLDADKIVFLADGKAAAAGSHEQLLSESALYRQMISQGGGAAV
ncbi:MAG: thiol reductant ABC exporter subunit CydD [Bacillota bacterium]